MTASLVITAPFPSGRPERCVHGQPVGTNHWYRSRTQEKRDNNAGSSRYTTLPKLLAHGFEKDGFCFGLRRLGAQNLWLEWIAFMIIVNEDWKLEARISRFVCCYLLTGKGFELEVEPNDNAVKADWKHGYIFHAVMILRTFSLRRTPSLRVLLQWCDAAAG